VTWNDTQAFCQWLSQRPDGVRKGRKIGLPSEAEWEYVCRSGTTTRYGFGDNSELLAKNGNVADGTAKLLFPTWRTITGVDGYVFTAPTGQFKANAFGVHDMHGNVWEWCSDWLDTYEGMPLKDPLRKDTFNGERRVVRGGSWLANPIVCRAAFRFGYPPNTARSLVGFRVCFRLE